jgi:uncharacterized protein (DUF2062 family)
VQVLGNVVLGVQVKERKRVIIPFRPVIRWLVRLRKSPRAIAGGFSLGTFIAFTPTLGVQIAIAIFLATLFNLNRPASLVMIWITNAATAAPIYTFNYLIGKLFWAGPPVGEVYATFMELTGKLLHLDFWSIADQFAILASLGREIIIPLLIGSCIVGLIAALLTYGLSLFVISYLVNRRNSKRAKTTGEN